MAKTNKPFIIDELYERLGISDLPELERQQLDNLIANWRLQYQTDDGRLGSDLVDYHDAEADLGVMAQKFLEHIRNGPSYWRYDKQEARYDQRADEIRRLLGQVFCQKNLDAAKNACKFQIEGEKRRSNNIAPVASMLPVASDVAVSNATQSQDQSGGVSSDDGSYCESAIGKNHYDTPRRSNRKPTPSKKRQKIAHPQGKPSETRNRCKQHHTKSDGSQPCISCIKAGKPCVHGTLASSAGLKAKEDVTTHSAQLGSETGLASPVSSSAPVEAATAVSSPADSRTDAPAPRPMVTKEPDSIEFSSPDWRGELVSPPDTNTAGSITHQRRETYTRSKGEHHPERVYQVNTNPEAHNTDQTPKPKVSTIFMVLTGDQGRETIKTHWPEGSLSGKTLGDVLHEAEALVRRDETEEVDFELKGLNTSFRICVPAGDEKKFEFMRRYFNQEAKKECKEGRREFEIWLKLRGGIEHGDRQVENEIKEQSDFEDIC